MIWKSEDNFAIVNTPKDGRCKPELLCWLTSGIGLPWDRILIVSHTRGDIQTGYNLAIRSALQTTNAEQFIFCDDDIRPVHNLMSPWINAKEDVVGCVYNTAGGDFAFASDSIIHAGLWRTHRSVLETIKPPWFSWIWSEDGSTFTGCLCSYFCKKVKEAGFTISASGFANHSLDRWH